MKATVYGSKLNNSSIGEMCSLTPFQQVNIGQEVFLKNWVKERKYNYAQLGLTPNTHSKCHLEGKWSPDSI